MKSGIAIALFALQGLHEEQWSEHNLTVFFCGDEETGHPRTNAKEIIRELARGKDAVFNMETGNLDGSVVVSRKGLAYVGFRVDGIAAHSGKDPEKGASAIRELCFKIGKLYAIEDPEKGISFNAGKIAGGIVANGIASYAEFWGDCRFARAGDYEDILDFFRRVAEEVHVPRTRTTFVYDEKRTFLPMDRTEGNMKLYEVVRRQGEKLGIEVKGIPLGSCSDSCWTVQVGAPTVCAMGGRGLFNHSPEEYMILSSLTERAQLLALSLQNL
jgi:glutamate carboxypeptidase